jgi:hypothetical protein
MPLLRNEHVISYAQSERKDRDMSCSFKRKWRCSSIPKRPWTVSIIIKAEEYTVVMLTFGCLCVIGNIIIADYVKLPMLATTGWLLIAISVLLFILKTTNHKRKR